MRHSLLIALVFFSANAFTQNSTKVETDTSIIETRYFQGLNSIRTFNRLKGKDRIYYTDVFFKSKKLKEQGVFEGGDYTGVWKEFFENGELKKEIDYTNGVILFLDKRSFPFFERQTAYKLKADSIIKKLYSEEFFSNHVVWSIGGSYCYNKLESHNWMETFKDPPYKFLLRYSIRADDKIYKKLIEFEIDSNGLFIPNRSERIYGFELLPDNSPKTFTLTAAKAFELAKKQGLIETDTTRASTFLSWENIETENLYNLYNGRFVYYVMQKTGTEKGISSNGRSIVTDKFEAYTFNPWTSEFIEKKKMKTVRSWEENSGSNTGLIPDNNQE